MNYFIRCISAEILKTRRTIHLLSVIVMPTILTLLNFLLMLSVSTPDYYRPERGWVDFEHNTITFWALLVFPCVIVLVSAFSAHQEHDTKRWRNLMCLPLPKSALYGGKLAVVMALAFLSCLMVWVENIFWGWLLSLLRPEAGLSLDTLRPGKMLVPFLFIYLFSLLLLAVHYWFSLRVQNFVLSIGAGFVLCLVGAFLHEEAVWRVVFPWSLPALVYTTRDWREVILGLLYSGLGFAGLAWLGCRSFIRRDVLS